MTAATTTGGAPVVSGSTFKDQDHVHHPRYWARSTMCDVRDGQRRRYAALHEGPPVERVWILWHMSIGLGAGLLSWPSVGPAAILIAVFLWSAAVIVVGLVLDSAKAVSRGLALLAVASALRAFAVWDVSQMGAGSNWIASFTWSVIAIGNLMESVSARQRGIQTREDGDDARVRRRDGTPGD